MEGKPKAKGLLVFLVFTLWLLVNLSIAEVTKNQRERANKVLNENPELYRPQSLKNLETGRATQKDQGINIGNPVSQRLKSLKRFDFLELNGKKYSLNKEHRIYICETTFDYYVLYAPKKK